MKFPSVTEWSGVDYLLTKIVLIGLSVAVPVSFVGPQLLDWLRGRPLETTLRLDQTSQLPTQLVAANEGATLTWDGTTRVVLADPSAYVRGLSLAATLVGVICLVAGLAILLRLVNATKAGTPFTPLTVRSLRQLGTLAVVGGFGSDFLRGMADSEVAHRAVDGTVTDGFTLGIVWAMIAVVTWLLAEVFRLGLKVTEDAEGLV